MYKVFKSTKEVLAKPPLTERALRTPPGHAKRRDLGQRCDLSPPFQPSRRPPSPRTPSPRASRCARPPWPVRSSAQARAPGPARGKRAGPRGRTRGGRGGIGHMTRFHCLHAERPDPSASVRRSAPFRFHFR
nr:unnamed protein product [Rangifer tarandus platyrhynchus]